MDRPTRRLLVRAANMDPITDQSPEVEALYITMDKLLNNLIMPAFSWFPQGKYHSGVGVQAGDFIRFVISIAYTPTVLSKTIKDMTPYVENYYNLRGNIYELIKSQFYPTVKPQNLIDVGLSPEQFMISFKDMIISPYIATVNRVNGEIAAVFNVIVIITLMIEDVSILKPGEIGELAARFSYLCSAAETHGVNELRKWVLSLPGAPDQWTVNRMNKEQLCLILKDRYEF